MITNPESIKNTYICNKIVADFLIYKRNQPLLSVKDGKYYFTLTHRLGMIIKQFPLWVKVASKLF